MRIWIPGAKGMLGKAVCAACRVREIEFIGTDRELDITSPSTLAQFASFERFTHVINCAAYTNVDACETDEAAVRRLNSDGAANVATAARACDAIPIHVSTDYVFPGNATRPYREDDQTGPINVYGHTKLLGELKFREIAPDGYVVRTSWLFGDGNNFVATMLRLFAEKSVVRVVGDQTGRPTYAPDLADALIDLAIEKPEAGTYHFANAGHTTWFDLAVEIHMLAMDRGRPITAALGMISTVEYPTAARRPAYSVLATDKIEGVGITTPRPWRDALVSYLDTLQERT